MNLVGIYRTTLRVFRTVNPVGLPSTNKPQNTKHAIDGYAAMYVKANALVDKIKLQVLLMCALICDFDIHNL